ncbi:hypothetical protein [Mycoplasma hafezii]|uniref:hypothetical protein n=1 Tax=Mycoplasma hafezii TaxID=525886 RepID=UPI003CFB1A12
MKYKLRKYLLLPATLTVGIVPALAISCNDETKTIKVDFAQQQLMLPNRDVTLQEYKLIQEVKVKPELEATLADTIKLLGDFQKETEFNVADEIDQAMGNTFFNIIYLNINYRILQSVLGFMPNSPKFDAQFAKNAIEQMSKTNIADLDQLLTTMQGNLKKEDYKLEEHVQEVQKLFMLYVQYLLKEVPTKNSLIFSALAGFIGNSIQNNMQMVQHQMSNYPFGQQLANSIMGTLQNVGASAKDSELAPVKAMMPEYLNWYNNIYTLKTAFSLNDEINTIWDAFKNQSAIIDLNKKLTKLKALEEQVVNPEGKFDLSLNNKFYALANETTQELKRSLGTLNLENINFETTPIKIKLSTTFNDVYETYTTKLNDAATHLNQAISTKVLPAIAQWLTDYKTKHNDYPLQAYLVFYQNKIQNDLNAFVSEVNSTEINSFEKLQEFSQNLFKNYQLKFFKYLSFFLEQDSKIAQEIIPQIGEIGKVAQSLKELQFFGSSTTLLEKYIAKSNSNLFSEYAAKFNQLAPEFKQLFNSQAPELTESISKQIKLLNDALTPEYLKAAPGESLLPGFSYVLDTNSAESSEITNKDGLFKALNTQLSKLKDELKKAQAEKESDEQKHKVEQISNAIANLEKQMQYTSEIYPTNLNDDFLLPSSFVGSTYIPVTVSNLNLSGGINLIKYTDKESLKALKPSVQTQILNTFKNDNSAKYLINFELPSAWFMPSNNQNQPAINPSQYTPFEILSTYNLDQFYALLAFNQFAATEIKLDSKDKNTTINLQLTYQNELTKKSLPSDLIAILQNNNAFVLNSQELPAIGIIFAISESQYNTLANYLTLSIPSGVQTTKLSDLANEQDKIKELKERAKLLIDFIKQEKLDIKLEQLEKLLTDDNVKLTDLKTEFDTTYEATQKAVENINNNKPQNLEMKLTFNQN